MLPVHRIQKKPIASTHTRRRGRPPKCSESWKKKLILLRMCGLDISQVLAVLTMQSDGAAETKPRRAQQLIKQLLADNQERYQPPSKLVARRRAAFIRASLRPDGDRNPRPIKQEAKAALYRAKSTTYLDIEAYERNACEATGPLSSNKIEAVPTDGSPAESVPSPDTRTLSTRSLFSPFSSGTAETENTHPSASGNDTWSAWVRDTVAPASNIYTTDTDEDITFRDVAFDGDRAIWPSSRMERMINTLSRRTSISSSYWSDIWSLIDRRMSISTFTSSRRSGDERGSLNTFTSSRRSESVSSLTETELSYIGSKAEEVMDSMRETISKANFALARSCCVKSTDCRHRLVSRVSESNPHLVMSYLYDLIMTLTATPVLQPPQDSYGNSELFFAARIGSMPDILLSLLSVTDNVNAVNADGQNFLFFLDTRYFLTQDSPCSSSGTRMHRSSFECLVCALERCLYDFDHLDNHGRHFLMYLCASPHFNIRWLLELVFYSREWEDRVRRVSQLRDVGGTFLLEYMSLHPAFGNLDEEFKSLFRPQFGSRSHPVYQFKALHNEDEHGRSRFHQYVSGGLCEAPLEEVVWSYLSSLLLENACDINKYDGHGRTPIMDYLLRAFDTGLEENIICTRFELLLKCGANVNARSRGGSTVLHFAAKKAMPKLLELLLNTNIQVDYQDKAGMSALDYAAKVLQRSRSAKSRVEVMARSLKTTAQLLSVTSQIKPRDRGSPDQRSSRDINKRAQRNVEQLSRLREQKYPPSVPVRFSRRRE